MRARSLACAVAALAAALSAHAGDDWPQWRGPNRDGISRETGLRQSWPADGPPLDWKAGGLGAGYSTVTVDSGRIFTLGADDEIEYVIALDAETGRELWRTRNGRRYRDRRGDGPRGAPTVDGSAPLRARRKRRPDRARRGHRQEALVDQPSRDLRRPQHPVGHQRVAPRARGPSARQRGRTRRVDRRPVQGRRLGPVEERGGRGGLQLRGIGDDRRSAPGGLLHRRARPRHRRRRRPRAVAIPPGVEPHRQRRDAGRRRRATSSSPRTTEPAARSCGSSDAGTSGRRKRSTSAAR